jgi:four helix bundle protein
LAVAIYKQTAGFPSAEKYGLTSQLRRAAVSIPSNIAEGQGRLTKGEFSQFLGHARGSLHELETQLEIAAELGLITKESVATITQQAGEVGRILSGLIESVETKSKKAGAGR